MCIPPEMPGFPEMPKMDSLMSTATPVIHTVNSTSKFAKVVFPTGNSPWTKSRKNLSNMTSPPAKLLPDLQDH